MLFAECTKLAGDTPKKITWRRSPNKFGLRAAFATGLQNTHGLRTEEYDLNLAALRRMDDEPTAVKIGIRPA